MVTVISDIVEQWRDYRESAKIAPWMGEIFVNFEVPALNYCR